MNNGWKECKLGDVIELIGGGTPKTAVADYWNGNIPWLSVVDFNTGNKYVQSCYGIRCIPKATDQKYIYYLTKYSINNFKQIAHGGVFDTITRETFDQIEIELPPRPEQHAIAGALYRPAGRRGRF